MTEVDYSAQSGDHSAANGHILNGDVHYSVDDHFSYFRDVYNRANDNFLVQKAKDSYGSVKHRYQFVENALNVVEDRVAEAAQVAAPLYENYCFPTTDRLFSIYNKGVEGSKTAVAKTKSAASATGTVSVGLAVVATQVGLIAGVTATNLMLDGVIATKNAGGFVVGKGMALEKAVEQRLYETIESTQRLAKVPVDKLNEHANTVVDVANAVFERLLSLPTEVDQPEWTLSQRVVHLAQRIAGGLSTRAHSDVIDPLQRQIYPIVEQLNKSLTLVNAVQQHRQWAFDKVDQLSGSVLELRSTIEEEAGRCRVAPEETLLRYIQRTSGKLTENLKSLSEKSQEILSDTISTRLETAAEYFAQMDNIFANAESIYQVQNEAIEEAKQKLREIAAITSAFVVRNGVAKEQEDSA
jgi:hypothetical protein